MIIESMIIEPQLYAKKCRHRSAKNLTFTTNANDCRRFLWSSMLEFLWDGCGATILWDGCGATIQRVFQ